VAESRYLMRMTGASVMVNYDKITAKQHATVHATADKITLFYRFDACAVYPVPWQFSLCKIVLQIAGLSIFLSLSLAQYLFQIDRTKCPLPLLKVLITCFVDVLVHVAADKCFQMGSNVSQLIPWWLDFEFTIELIWTYRY